MFLRDDKTLALVRSGQLVVRSWRDDHGRFLALVRSEPPRQQQIRVVLGWDHELAR